MYRFRQYYFDHQNSIKTYNQFSFVVSHEVDQFADVVMEKQLNYEECLIVIMSQHTW